MSFIDPKIEDAEWNRLDRRLRSTNISHADHRYVFAPSRSILEERGYRARSAVLFATLERNRKVPRSRRGRRAQTVTSPFDVRLSALSIPRTFSYTRFLHDEMSVAVKDIQHSGFSVKRDAICHDPQSQTHKFEIHLKISLNAKILYYILTGVR